MLLLIKAVFIATYALGSTTIFASLIQFGTNFYRTPI